MRFWRRLWNWLTGRKVPVGASALESLGAPAPRGRRPSASGLEALDVAQFAPLERADALQAARGLNRWGPWFGRRDVIPPTSDPRTLFIDREMVGLGLASPEELAALHAVGDEVLRQRPDLMGAAFRAREAVARSQAERAERKRQKQAAAAARRQAHAEAVAQRKATDIVFLGRGVSRGLADRHANVELLQQHGLPVMATPADVATALGLTIPRLRWLAFHTEASTVTHYVRFDVPKKNGGVRQLAAPHRDLKRCQRWILDHVLSRLPVHPAAHGFVTSRSTVTNAQPHVGAAIVVNTDLADFFPSISFHRVLGLMQSWGYSPAVATILALLCTECPRRTAMLHGTTYHVAIGPRSLPQGACTSPALSNLIARGLDSRLTGIATKLGWKYTRYADDATFSTPTPDEEHIGYLLARIRHIADDEGFRVNEQKTRVLRRNASQRVTGLVVNDGVHVPRAVRRRLRAILHQSQQTGLAAQNRQQHPRFTDWVQGLLAYIAMVNPGHARQLRGERNAEGEP